MGKYSKPWSPELLFSDDHPNTLPYEHEEVILYHGTSRKIFYKESVSDDDPRSARSILEEGYLSPGNGYKNDYPDDYLESDEFNAGKDAIYLGFKPVAIHFAAKNEPGIVLRVKVPSSSLITITLPENWKREEALPLKENWRYPTNLNQLSQMFSSREGFRRHCERAAMIEMGDKISEESIQFAVREPLALERIGSVHDDGGLAMKTFDPREMNDFKPYKQYIQDITHNFPEKMPVTSNPGAVYEKLELYSKLLTDIEKSLEMIGNGDEEGYMKYNQFLTILENRLREDYNYNLSSKRSNGKVIKDGQQLQNFLNSVTRKKLVKIVEKLTSLSESDFTVDSYDPEIYDKLMQDAIIPISEDLPKIDSNG